MEYNTIWGYPRQHGAGQDRTRGSGFSLIEMRFRLNIGNIFFTVRLVPEQAAQRSCGCTVIMSAQVRLNGTLNNLVYLKVSMPRAGVLKLGDL